MSENNNIFINLSDVINNTIEGILVIEEGFIKNINHSLLEILGYENKEELIDKLATGILIPTSKEKFIKYNEKLFQEISLITKDGNIIPVIIKIKNVQYKDKEYKMVFILDLSELKEKEKMVIRQSKLSAMGEMLSMIAHQWRQPLSTISTMITRIKLKNEINKLDKIFLDTILNDINKYIQYMSTTIDDFRNFFTIDSKKELITLNEIVIITHKMLEKTFLSQNIKIEIKDKKLSKLNLPKNELIQIILNILNNSKDAILEKNIENPLISISFNQNKKEQKIFIEDNAGGIDENIISKIFNPYFSTKNKKNGSGLGLYICKNILEKDNLGDIFVENKKNGVLFTIIINRN
ncbi:MAG: PAS domain-containing sensor histidine kinase [Arcobacter sp.]|jgi:PAS domain S-box-containing protein|uniref:PAS domain-containing sensor histidine kinase n=1 Tax=unclassified Arcobacter TaxID=2593671 RepID=UPI0002296139|nr:MULTISPECIES: PAS domain-containing sensor histidine kinase [unclassified Arcobacter]MDY3199751.1 PAS domain-containing sensor histidine kinase [Arcobacter sp.]BAK73524.1 two-component sensor kinase [Arcobacter sp. L]